MTDRLRVHLMKNGRIRLKSFHSLIGKTKHCLLIKHLRKSLLQPQSR